MEISVTFNAANTTKSQRFKSLQKVSESNSVLFHLKAIWYKVFKWFLLTSPAKGQVSVDVSVEFVAQGASGVTHGFHQLLHWLTQRNVWWTWVSACSYNCTEYFLPCTGERIVDVCCCQISEENNGNSSDLCTDSDLLFYVLALENVIHHNDSVNLLQIRAVFSCIQRTNKQLQILFGMPESIQTEPVRFTKSQNDLLWCRVLPWKLFLNQRDAASSDQKPCMFTIRGQSAVLKASEKTASRCCLLSQAFIIALSSFLLPLSQSCCYEMIHLWSY